MFIGVDIGTTGIKVIIVDANGKIISGAYRTYSTLIKSNWCIECDPDVVWTSFLDSLQEAVSIIPDKNEIKCICFSSLGEAFIPIDNAGNKLMNSIIATDTRGREEFGEFSIKIDQERLATITGHTNCYDYSVSKMLWLKKNCNDIYDNAWKLLLFGDYFGFRLTGQTFIDYSLASRTMLLDIRRKTWSEEIADIANLDLKKLSKPVQSGSIIGKIKPEICNRFGLSERTVVVAGGHDVPCALLGCGITKPGKAEDTTGTTECISTVVGHEPLSPQIINKSNLVCEPFISEGTYNTLAFMWNAGSVLEWYMKNVLKIDKYRSKEIKNIFRKYDSLCVKDPQDMFVLPQFSGTGTLNLNQLSAGAFIGMTLDMDDANIYQAIIESITYEMRLNLDLILTNGIPIEELIAVGGGARSPFWLQVKANIFERPIKTLENSEAGAMGAAIIGATAVGEYGTFDEAAANMVHVKQIYYPETNSVKLYKERFNIYKGLYSALQKTHEHCRKLNY